MHWTNREQYKKFDDYNVKRRKKKFDNFKNYNASNLNIKKFKFFNKNFNRPWKKFNKFSFKSSNNNLFKTQNYVAGFNDIRFDGTSKFSNNKNNKYFIRNNNLQLSSKNKFSLFNFKQSRKFLGYNSQNKYQNQFINKKFSNIKFRKNNKFFRNFNFYSKKGLTFSNNRRFYNKYNYYQKKFINRRFKQYYGKKRSRFLKGWRTCKKPFWKRKSFKFIKLYNLIFLNLFKAYSVRRLKMRNMRRKKVIGFDRRGRKRKKRFIGKRFWHEYFRRNKIKFWFRNKIALRFAWMTRYSCWTHRKAAKFVWRIRRRTPALLRFWRRFEFTLDRYILWWQIAPRLTRNSLYFSRQIIINGYVYVNFVIQIFPNYQIQLGDCVFVLKQFYKGYHKVYLTEKLINPFKSLFRRGYRLRCITRFQPRYLFKKKFMFFLKRYKMLKNLSHWNKSYFLYFRYFVEKSYKYRIFVNLHSMSWFTLIFSTIGKLYYPITYYFINSFVNRRYG